MATTNHDVVIIGAGIGGAALAAALARGGLDVLLLEKSTTYADRVRGEALALGASPRRSDSARWTR